MSSFVSIQETVVNEPFAGTYVPLDFCGADPRVTSIMIEIRRDTYVGKSAAIEQWGQALAALIASIQAR